MSHSDYRVTSEMNWAGKCPSGTEPTQRDLHLRLITERGRMAWQRPPAITGGRRWRRTSAATSRVVACADRSGTTAASSSLSSLLPGQVVVSVKRDSTRSF
jgi:hypothetical protein